MATEQDHQVDLKSLLSGRRIAVVEDRFFAAMELTTTLESCGCVVVGPLSTENRARQAVENQRPDLVLLDIDLHGVPSFNLARHLSELGIPVIFVTGSGRYFASPDDLADIPRLQKPVDRTQLLTSVASELHAQPEAAGGTS